MDHVTSNACANAVSVVRMCSGDDGSTTEDTAGGLVFKWLKVSGAGGILAASSAGCAVFNTLAAADADVAQDTSCLERNSANPRNLKIAPFSLAKDTTYTFQFAAYMQNNLGKSNVATVTVSSSATL